MTPMLASDPARELPADPYHSGVRFGALVLWLFIVLALYAALAYLAGLIFPDLGAGWLIIIAVVLLVSQPVARWSEKQLIQRWPSGRAVRLPSRALLMKEKTGDTRFELDGARVNYWRWHFVVKNRRGGGRVANGDCVCALRLVQGENAASLYAFVPKKEAESLLGRYVFYEVQRAAKNQPALGGRDAVYLAAEQARWESGAELSPADFAAVLDHLAAHVPEFKSAPSS